MLSLFPLLCALSTCSEPPGPPTELVLAMESVLADAIEKAEPSVVAIMRWKAAEGDATTAIRGRNPVQNPNVPRGVGPQFNPNFGDDMISSDYGSGVVIGDAGEMLTAFHVVKGAERLVVRAVDRQVFEAEIIAADPRS